MKILLLGGEGFIGYNLLESLQQDFNCCSIGAISSPFRKNLSYFSRMNPYKDPINNFYDIYIHLIDNRNPENKEEELLRNISPKSHIILFSSAVVYANPNSEYGIRKLNIEEYYKNYCGKNNIKLTILRLFNIYGKYQIPYRQGSLVANILYNHINGIPIQINDINIARDFIFAEDIPLYIKYIIGNSIYGTYDLASGKMSFISELIELIEDIVQAKLNIINLANKDFACPSAVTLVPCKINSIGLKSGMEKTLDFYKKNNELIRSLVK